MKEFETLLLVHMSARRDALERIPELHKSLSAVYSLQQIISAYYVGWDLMVEREQVECHNCNGTGEHGATWCIDCMGDGIVDGYPVITQEFQKHVSNVSSYIPDIESTLIEWAITEDELDISSMKKKIVDATWAVYQENNEQLWKYNQQ